MDEMVAPVVPQVSASYAISCPLPDRAEGRTVAQLLREVVPLGAPAVRCWPHGQIIEHDHGPDRFGIECVLPLIDSEDARPLDRRIADLRRNDRPLPDAAREALIAMLAPNGLSHGGLPRYVPAGPDDGGQVFAALGTLQPGEAFLEVTRFEAHDIPGSTARFTSATVRRRQGRASGRTGQRNSAPVRRLLVAVAYDILGLSTPELGTRMLGHAPNGIESSSYSWKAGSGPEKYRRDGRKMLAELGVWPWCLVPNGRLPRQWRREVRFADALRAWCETHRESSASPPLNS